MGAQAQALGAELLKVEKQISQFLDRIISTETPSVIAAYEDKVKALEGNRLLIKERMANAGLPPNSFDA